MLFRNLYHGQSDYEPNLMSIADDHPAIKRPSSFVRCTLFFPLKQIVCKNRSNHVNIFSTSRETIVDEYRRRNEIGKQATQGVMANCTKEHPDLAKTPSSSTINWLLKDAEKVSSVPKNAQTSTKWVWAAAAQTGVALQSASVKKHQWQGTRQWRGLALWHDLIWSKSTLHSQRNG